MVRFSPRSIAVGTVALTLSGFMSSQSAQAPTAAPAVAPTAGTAATPITTQVGAAPRVGAAQGDSANITTLRAYSNLVVIDVVVSDGKQNAVHGLTKADFTLTENGKQQTIRNFEEHTVATQAETTKAESAPKLPPGLFTNKAAAPASGPVNVLLLDYLNTPLTAQPYARQQLMDYLNKAPAGTRIAIFALATNLVMLQGFSSDPEVLKAALNNKKGAARASDILSDPEFGGPQGNSVLSDTFQSDALDAAQQLANIQRAQALEASFEQDLRTKITLGAFDLLSRYLVGIPGRKNVIWYSGSFPLSVEPSVNIDNQDAFDTVVRNDEEVRKTANLLTRAQVAVYPVDARGLFNNSANGAMNGASTPGNMGGQGTDPDSQMNFMQQTAQEHETMQAMAEDTGGHAFINTNGLSQAIAKAVENGSNYYTLTYVPENKQWDGRFRAVKVKVEKPGVKLAYRNGYYADDPNDRNRVIAGQAATTTSRPTGMTTAMLRGGPDPAEIVFKVRIRPASAPPADTPVRGNNLNPDPKVKVSGPYKEYGVDVVPDHNAINCKASADGNRHCSLELATYVYDRDGQLIVANSARTSATLSPANYAQMQMRGMAFHQEISVPVKGTYYVRTAIHDLTSDRIGAVEVPISAVAHLQPLDPLPAVRAPVQVPTTSTSGPAGSVASFPTGNSTDSAPPAPDNKIPAATTTGVSPGATPTSPPPTKPQ